MNHTNLESEFDKYFNAPEGYGLRSERLYLLLGLDQEKFALLTKWMRYTFQQGVELGYKKAAEELGENRLRAGN